MDETQIAEVSSQEAIKAAAVHAEAVEVARKAQLESAIVTNREETHEQLVSALKEVLIDNDSQPLLIKRIPFICTDIITMKNDIGTIKTIVGYLLLGIGMLFLTLVGGLLLKGI